MQAFVTINSRGAITVPVELRQTLCLKAESQLIAEITPEGVLLRPAVTLPVELYTSHRVQEFDQVEAELAQTVAKHRLEVQVAGMPPV